MDKVITNVIVTENVTLISLINIPTCDNIIAKIFLSLSASNVNVDMISQTSPLKGTINISFTISDDDLFSAMQTLKNFNSQVPNMRIEVNSNNSKILLYGEAMRHTPGIAAKTLEVFANNNIDIIMITTSEIDISYLIYNADIDKAVTALKNI